MSKKVSELLGALATNLLDAGVSEDDAQAAVWYSLDNTYSDLEGVPLTEVEDVVCEILEDKLLLPPSDFLWGAFVWDSTPEGHAYWGRVVRRLP